MTASRHRHVVLEIDGDRWAATVARIEPKRFVVQECHRHDPDQEGASDASGLLRWLQERGLLEVPTHLVVADPSVRRFSLTLPNLSRKDLASVLERQARTMCSLDASHPLALSWRRSGKADKQQTNWAVLAVQLERRGERSLAQEILTHPDLNRAAVCEMGEAVLHSLPDDIPDHLAVVDANSQGLRVVYLEHGLPRQERRIGLAAPPADVEALADVLEIEIPRTLDYLAEQGLPAPEALSFAPSLGLDEACRRRAAGDLRVLDVQSLGDERLPEGDPPPLGTLGYLRHLAGGKGLTVLQTRHKRPRAVMLPIAAALLLMIGSSGVVGGLRWQDEISAAGQRIASIEDEVSRWQSEQERAERESALMDAAQMNRLESILGMRRPASLLVAEVCRLVPGGVSLSEVAFAPDGSIHVDGYVEGQSRLDAVRLVGRYRADLRTVPFLTGITESVDYETALPSDDGSDRDDQAAGRLTFRLSMRWGA